MVSFYHPPDYREARVILRWAGPRVSGRELIALRRVVPDFAELGLEAVRERIGDGECWDLGVFPRGFAVAQSRSIATEHGLRVELIDV